MCGILNYIMKIYHYTSIETLALILDSQKIRFNRLDRVDDLEESCYGSGDYGIKLGQYIFVSCWTKFSNENLALWNMYTNNKGVRIALDEDMFVNYDNGGIKSFFSQPLLWKEDYFTSSIVNSVELHDIHYVPDPIDNIKALVKEERRNESDGMNIDIKNAGLYKRMEWECQRESRFRIVLLPSLNRVENTENANQVMNFISELQEALIKNKTLERRYIDIPLNPDKLANIEVMLGPQTSYADKLIVQSLLRDYPQAKICNSFFYDKINKK